MEKFFKIPVAGLEPRLRAVVRKNQILIRGWDGSPLKKTGAVFVPAGTSPEVESPVILAPKRWGQRAQREFALKLEGFFHGTQVARLNQEDAQASA